MYMHLNTYTHIHIYIYTYIYIYILHIVYIILYYILYYILYIILLSLPVRSCRHDPFVPQATRAARFATDATMIASAVFADLQTSKIIA